MNDTPLYENVILIGIPGAGKSTLAEKFKDTHVILNPDSIRKKLWGSENYQGPWGDILMEMVSKNLAHPDKPILIDATCLRKDRRMELFNYFQAKSNRFGWVAIWFDCPLEVALERNAKRARQVPEDLIRKMANELEAPTTGEGYGTVIHWSAVDNKVIAAHSNNPIIKMLNDVVKG